MDIAQDVRINVAIKILKRVAMFLWVLGSVSLLNFTINLPNLSMKVYVDFPILA